MTAEQPSPTSSRGGLAVLLDQAPDLFSLDAGAITAFSAERIDPFKAYNESRMGIAISAFETPMKYALYELFFLLNTNDPKLKDWKYLVRRYASESGKGRPDGATKVADLYVDGAPAGVKAFDEISSRLRSDYENHIRQEFRMDPFAGQHETAEFPIVALQAVGSTGTIGQKSAESDVDMQVIYETTPFAFDTSQWNDKVLSQAINKEYKLWLHHFSKKNKVTKEMLQKPEVRANLHRLAVKQLKTAYPYLYRALAEKDHAFAADAVKSVYKDTRRKVVREIFDLMKRSAKIDAGTRDREALFKKRVQAIQDYVNDKYPEAEIYLFVYTVEHFRSGTYDSTLEFKESSGSAYEFILNYETLMPGIQFTPLAPLHFLLPDAVNNNAAQYDVAMELVRFGLLPGFAASANRVVDLGPAIALDVNYIAQHGGAIYWEAFKASSGNLPKAMLNLLRFETLLDERHLHTIIHTIKNSSVLDGLCAPKPTDEKLMLRYEIALGQVRTGLAGWAALEIEERFPELKQDPWWLRYRALKIAFEEGHGIPGIEKAERDRLSSAIDLCFSLHLRISDVIKFAEEGRKPASVREKVLCALLEAAFPPDTSRRIHLNNLLTGDARGLINFENDMRDLFQRSMTRVEKKMAEANVREHVGKKEELDLWLNYYLENFQPQPSVVPRMIMKHLKHPRIGLHISFKPAEGWEFMSLQRIGPETLLQKHAKKTRYLPERIMLFQTGSFMIGLAHCIVNGYIGKYTDEAGQKRRTVIELDAVGTRQKEELDDKLATLTTEQVDRLSQRIASFFPYQYVDYKAILQPERRVTGVFMCVNAFYFGRVSVLYRNNINTWFCEETDLAELRDHAEDLITNADLLVKADALHDHLTAFLHKRQIDPARVPIGGWVNPNSFSGGHGVNVQSVLHGMESGTGLVERILQKQGVAPPRAQAQPA